MARFLMGSAPQLNTFYDRLLLFAGHKHAAGAPQSIWSLQRHCVS
jgi:hypothetical protein